MNSLEKQTTTGIVTQSDKKDVRAIGTICREHRHEILLRHIGYSCANGEMHALLFAGLLKSEF
jgi:hypothetical protein